ncbi:MAG: hypothetical protein ACP5FK_03580 [bacterium]
MNIKRSRNFNGLLTRFLLLLTLLTLAGFFIASCSQGDADQQQEEQQEEPEIVETGEMVIEETGTIDTDDITDPNHADLAYDAYTFEADRMDKVTVEVSSDDFDPLLKLVEVSTGAPLAEWDSQYPTGDNLTYTIAGPGEYEVRVYALESGLGDYSVKITVEK